MNNTKSEILRLADEMIRYYGFNAFSYSDISKKLNIKNAAIHYYFPSKTELGIAVIKEARKKFEDHITEWDLWDKREQYNAFVRSYNKDNIAGSLSLVSALTVSYDLLSKEMQQELKDYINLKHTWLSQLLKSGRESGVFEFETEPKIMAYIIQSQIFSSLALNRIMDDDVYICMQEEIINRV